MARRHDTLSLLTGYFFRHYFCFELGVSRQIAGNRKGKTEAERPQFDRTTHFYIIKLQFLAWLPI